MTLNEQIYAMLTESTGTHMLDSGGYYGRHWQRNQKKTLEDFQAEPSATVEIFLHRKDGVISYPEFLPSASIFHLLTDVLELDELCREFNQMDAGDWDGDYLGTSAEQCAWLNAGIGLVPEGEPFNTCNHSNALSQELWGAEFRDDAGNSYILLSIHNGADVRGGYTDAKLFKFRDYRGVYSIMDCDVTLCKHEGEYVTISWDDVRLFDEDGYEVAGDSELLDDDGRKVSDDDKLLWFAKSLGEGSHEAHACYMEG